MAFILHIFHTLHCALQHFAGDFDQTALSNIYNFSEDTFADAPQFRTQGQATTLGTSGPTLCKKCVGTLTSPGNQYREDTGDGTYGLSSLSKKTRTSNHLKMSLQRQNILRSYFFRIMCSQQRNLNLRDLKIAKITKGTLTIC